MGFDSYQLISGERRTRASRLAGLTNIPAYIRLANDQEMLEMALIENIQREDLNAIEVAISYKRLMDECSLNQEQLGDRVGKNRSTVSNYLRLLNLPVNIQAALRDDKISMGHARAIIGIEDADEQQYLFDQMIENNLSVRAVESLVRKASEESSQKTKEGTRKKNEPSLTYVDFQNQLSSKFDTKIKIKADDRGRGSITIPFKSQQDLQRILDLI
jgi:ParB family chromosome partitioning protein